MVGYRSLLEVDVHSGQKLGEGEAVGKNGGDEVTENEATIEAV